jgi:hypothetical protein
MTQTTACCTAVTPVTVTECEKTQGPFGEIINPWTTHPAITATSEIISLPVDPAPVINTILELLYSIFLNLHYFYC